jgi:hypothetical protein
MAEPKGSSLPASLRRIRALARHTLAEGLHQRLALVGVLAGAALLGGAVGLREFNFGTAELKFLEDLGLGSLGLSGTVLAALMTPLLLFREMESRVIYAVLTRPVRRWEYVAGKLAGVAGLLAVYLMALSLLLAGILAWRGLQLGVGPLLPRLFYYACAVLWMKSTLVAAMSMLVCSYAGSALFASCAGLLLALIGQLRPWAPGAGLNWLRAWPNLGVFDAERLLDPSVSPTAAWGLGLSLYWAAYLLLFGVLASHGFKHREF